MQQVTVDDEVRHDEGVSQVARVIALVTGALVAIIGLVAAIDMDWGSAEADSPIVDVSGMPFTPVATGVTIVLGLILLAVAASRNGEGRVAMGGITAAVGLAIILADLESRWNVNDRQGWALLIVGVVFIVSGLLDRSDRYVHRHQQVVDVR